MALTVACSSPATLMQAYSGPKVTTVQYKTVQLWGGQNSKHLLWLAPSLPHWFLVEEVVYEVGHEHTQAHRVDQHTATHALWVLLGNVAGNECACSMSTRTGFKQVCVCTGRSKLGQQRQ